MGYNPYLGSVKHRYPPIRLCSGQALRGHKFHGFLTADCADYYGLAQICTVGCWILDTGYWMLDARV